MPGPTPHRTPLRRVSQGSLFALSRSGTFPDAPHGLGFLEPAMSELADEAEALQANMEGLHKLGQALETFNEGFASYLYVMTMNALTTDWPQAPTDASFLMGRRRAEEDARAALAVIQATTGPAPNTPGLDKTTTSANESSFPENATAINTVKPVGILKNGPTKGKKKAKPKLTAKEKKERAIAIDSVVIGLPLEFRGSDPNLRRNIDMVVEILMDSPKQGIRMQEIVRLPDLTQAKVNKCLIALVNRKIVVKDSSSGTLLYVWHGVATRP